MKNIVLKTITKIDALIWVVSACLVDSRSWIPVIMLFLTTFWMILFSYANFWSPKNTEYSTEEDRRKAFIKKWKYIKMGGKV